MRLHVPQLCAANGSVTVQYEGPNAVTVKYGIEVGDRRC